MAAASATKTADVKVELTVVQRVAVWGILEGVFVGWLDGCVVGRPLGHLDGCPEGWPVGCFEGPELG